MFKALPAVVRASALTLALGLGAPSVMAQTPTFNVRDIDNPGRAAFQIGLCTIGWPPGCGQILSQYRVPTGHRLVIEFVSANCLVGTVNDRIGTMLLTTTVGGNVVRHQFVPVASAGHIERVSFVSQPTRIYADADTTVSSNASSSSGEVGCQIGLSGSLVRL